MPPHGLSLEEVAYPGDGRAGPAGAPDAGETAGPRRARLTGFPRRPTRDGPGSALVRGRRDGGPRPGRGCGARPRAAGSRPTERSKKKKKKAPRRPRGPFDLPERGAASRPNERVRRYRRARRARHAAGRSSHHIVDRRNREPASWPADGHVLHSVPDVASASGPVPPGIDVSSQPLVRARLSAAGPHPRSLSLGASPTRSGAAGFSLLAGPHPRSLSLGDFAPRSGRRRFSMLAGPTPARSRSATPRPRPQALVTCWARDRFADFFAQAIHVHQAEPDAAVGLDAARPVGYLHVDRRDARLRILHERRG